MSDTPLKKTAIHAWHIANGGRMVPFAGYELPVHYAAGVLKEHLHVRSSAGVFDVSHMGIACLDSSDGAFDQIADAFERLVPADVRGLAAGQQRYTQLLDENGGILDDLMVWRPPVSSGTLGLVVNAACKDADLAHIQANIPANVSLTRRDDLSFFALQGPSAEAVLAAGAPAVCKLNFMQTVTTSYSDITIHISRSGYTGEDGFEISVENGAALRLWTMLVGDARVLPIGLGARDSLRLEAGMCLYGSDIDRTTTPVEANLAWSSQKRRRVQGGFPGAERVQHQLQEGPARIRIGLKPVGRAPIRSGTSLLETETSSNVIGMVTSGGFGPSVGGPVAMGYVPTQLSQVGTRLFADVRGRRDAVVVHALPFISNRFKR